MLKGHCWRITLANIKSQIKRNRQNEKRRLRNRVLRGTARTAVKDARLAFEGEGEMDTPAAVVAAISALDRAAQRGAVHSRNAARRKGRLMKRLAALGTTPRAMEAAAPPAMVEPAAKPARQAKPAKEEKPAKEAKAKVDAKKPAAKKETKAAEKPAAKKPVEKKPAAKKTTAKK
jgi:small subunit ribosomal protein S20